MAFLDYHVFHFCGCGKMLSHSQADWNEHRACEGQWLTFPIEAFQELRKIQDNAKAKGLHPNINVVRDLIASTCYRKKEYKTYKRACKHISNMLAMMPYEETLF